MDIQIVISFLFDHGDQNDGIIIDLTEQDFIPRVGDELRIPDDCWSDVGEKSFKAFYDETCTVRSVTIMYSKEYQPFAHVFADISEKIH